MVNVFLFFSWVFVYFVSVNPNRNRTIYTEKLSVFLIAISQDGAGLRFESVTYLAVSRRASLLATPHPITPTPM
jgi:hypothetical protein